jgi:hypothetical protein
MKFLISIITSMILFQSCNKSPDNELDYQKTVNDYELKKRELDLKEKELGLKEKELALNNPNTFSLPLERINSELPPGAFLREYKKLIDVDDEIYIGLYVTDFSDPIVPVNPTNQDDLNNLFYTCADQTLGQSITGNYFAFVFKDNKIFSTVKIPAFDDNLSIYNTICLYNTPNNNCYHFNFGKNKKGCSNLSKNTLEKTNLIQLLDLTGDNKRNEFIITGIQDVCGYVNRVIVGYDEELSIIRIYPAVKNNYINFWNYRFVPLNGNCSVVVLCGDHGNGTYTREDYKFNSSLKQYDLVFEKRKACE